MRLLLLFLALFLSSYSALCQEYRFDIEKVTRDEMKFTLPDSLRHLAPWHPSLKDDLKIRISPAVSMSSIVLIEGNEFPTRIDVINKRTLRLFYLVEITNGQAWNWGPYPNAFLDARTLSFPGGGR